MKVLNILNFNYKGIPSTLYFGHPSTDIEFNDMFRLRYKIYAKKGYIDPHEFNHGIEKDNFDHKAGTFYFIAIFNNCVIGSVRLIKENKLPTEEYFSFNIPGPMREIESNKKAELGRLVVAPYLYNLYPPRNLVFLFLVNTLVQFSEEKQIQGGYSFVKKSLEEKMKKLKMPFHAIDEFQVKYPEDGVLSNYFYNQSEDPVIPIYFLTSKYSSYFKKVISNKLMFERKKGEIFLKTNLYTKFLKNYKII